MGITTLVLMHWNLKNRFSIQQDNGSVLFPSKGGEITALWTSFIYLILDSICLKFMALQMNM
jgi:hypothetical protein